MDIIETPSDVRTCRFPGCDRPAAAGESGSGRPPEYCDDAAHNRAAAWRARQAQRGTVTVPSKVDGRPVDSARQRASEIRSQVSGMIEHLEGQLRVLVEELGTVGDLDAAEAQAESVASDAAEAVASATARATRAEQAQRRAEAERTDADALTAEAIAGSELLERTLAEAHATAAATETACLQLVEELADTVAGAAADRESNRTTVEGLETELTTVRGSLAEEQRDHAATAARLVTMTATAATAESRATTAVATAAAATERAERAEAHVQAGRDQVDVLRTDLSAERDRAGAASSQVAVLTIERDNALAAVIREREYADQRIADLRAYERDEQGPESSDPRADGSAVPR
ncbi:hypothetical protein [Cryobacterium psychrophilum]|uniref:Chromosome segregation ATPase n=1 Tax=Cryobacterium psychrophilum TaxID=41988 RepID=A0A4Y8KK27_9MICO|nr:hypothetical protein [Cryobacterium psychrophilum]TDW26907.1 hypothetical protein EDD25_3469 [Cryobacterium psychrophilum]TFD75315.1 hypothetical protein E3T53_16040 [Cryobacterium psychrophilum]